MEIKEILDDIKDYSEHEYLPPCCELTNEECKHLLDYITNLQQELEEYKDTETYSKRFLYKANKDRLNANLELVKENERLKTKAKEQSLLLIDYQDMEQKYEDYKSRIEKAVELLNNDSKYTDDDFEGKIFQNDLLRILEGKDNEK